MSKVKALMLGLLAALLMTLAACDTATAPEDSAPVDVEAPGRGETGAADGCKEYLPSQGELFENGAEYTFDGDGRRGRPLRAQMVILPGRPIIGRSGDCQTKVGNLWDNPGDFPQYEAGHLIAKRFGGWNKRANLAPQATSLNNKKGNKGYWTKMEDALAKCGMDDNVRLDVTLIYSANENDIVPIEWIAHFDKLDTGNIRGVTFKNSNAEDYHNQKQLEKAQGILNDYGCN